MWDQIGASSEQVHCSLVTNELVRRDRTHTCEMCYMKYINYLEVISKGHQNPRTLCDPCPYCSEKLPRKAISHQSIMPHINCNWVTLETSYPVFYTMSHWDSLAKAFKCPVSVWPVPAYQGVAFPTHSITVLEKHGRGENWVAPRPSIEPFCRSQGVKLKLKEYWLR